MSTTGGKDTAHAIEVHHAVPRRIFKNYIKLFKDYLPGFEVDAPHNYVVTGYTQLQALQLDTLMHRGNHAYINVLDDLLKDFEIRFKTPEERTLRLAQLVNFLQEVTTLEGGAKNGFVLFVNPNDPHLIKKFGRKLTDEEFKKYLAEGLNWDFIDKSPAGQAVRQLGIRIEDGKLKWDGRLPNKGYFSVNSEALADPDTLPESHRKIRSADYGEKFKKINNINVMPDGSLVGASDIVKLDRETAIAKLETQLADGIRIGDFDKVGLRTWKGFGKALGLIGIATLVSMALDAKESQAAETYDPEKPNDVNKALIEEIAASGFANLAGMLAGAVAGFASLGMLAVPAMVVVGEMADGVGRKIGALFYEKLPALGNDIAEQIANLVAEGVKEAKDLAGPVAGAIQVIADDMWEEVFGEKGFFGLKGPLFGEGGPLVGVLQFLKEKGFIEIDGIWGWEDFDWLLEGTRKGDLLAHSGFGEVYGLDGDDTLIGWEPQFKVKGEKIFDDPESPLASKEMHLTLDGGAGDDWVLVFGGEKAQALDGPGRDWLFNTSSNGVLYGDTVDGLDPETGRGIDPQDPAHGDTFWWWPGVRIVDATPADWLTLFGVPLVGGTMEMPLLLARGFGLMPGMGYGLTKAVSGAVSLAALAQADVGLFHDNFLPFVSYVYERETGRLQVTTLLSALEGSVASARALKAQLTAASSSRDFGGLVVENFQGEGYMWGASLTNETARAGLQAAGVEVGDWPWGRGDLHMRFKLFNPTTTAMALC